MELVHDQEPTTIQFLILEENQVLPLKWYKPTYGSGHSWLIQAEGRSHCSGGQQAKSAICTMILRVGVAALRNYHTRLSKQSNVLAFAEQFHFQSMYRLHSFTDGKQLSLLKSRHCFDIKHTCHLILPRTHPQTIKKQIPNKIYNTKTTFMSMSNGSCPSKRQIKTLLMQVPSEAR